MKRTWILPTLLLVLTLAFSAAAAEEPAGGYPAAGTPISFNAFTLEGKKVTSKDIFGGHTLTAVNLWATFCGPCINEMPELETLSARLAEKDCALIGIVVDVGYGATPEYAQAILDYTGATYPNYLVNPKTINRILPWVYIPTTYFVDSEGKLAGEPLIGAWGLDYYEQAIDDLLEQ